MSGYLGGSAEVFVCLQFCSSCPANLTGAAGGSDISEDLRLLRREA